jgi:hypothetical protein
MNIDEFLESIEGTEARLAAPVEAAQPRCAPESIDALFHLPLLALAEMVIARCAPFRTVALGRSVAMLLLEHFITFQRARHRLETSITLRRRCADALAFLEAAGLVSVSQNQERTVTLTEAGRDHLGRAGRDETDLGLLVRKLRRNQERVIARLGDER